MRVPIFTGVATALVTPMQDDGSVNYGLFRDLVEEQVSRGADAVVAAGTTGESAALTDDEKAALISAAARQIRGRIPVIAGVGASSTAHAVSLCRQAQDAGADALLVATPYCSKAPQRGLLLHFQACARAVSLPVILYNVPSRTGVNLLPETCLSLCGTGNIRAVKDASGNLSQTARLAALCGDRLDIYSGCDDLTAPILSLGGKGVISVLSNLAPEAVAAVCSAFFQGDHARSASAQSGLQELAAALFSDASPIPVKQALRCLGRPVGPCRLPLCDMEPEAAKRLCAVLERYGLIRTAVPPAHHTA